MKETSSSKSLDEIPSFSRRDFLKGMGLVLGGLLLPQTIKNSVDKVLQEREDEILEPEKEKNYILKKSLSDRYIFEGEKDSFEIPIRDSLEIKNDSLIYHLPFDFENLSQIPFSDSFKNSRDHRKYYPLTSFYFYPSSSARFDRRYLTGENNWNRPPRETKVPLKILEENDLPEDLDNVFDQIEITDESLREKKNVIFSVFSPEGKGKLFVYIDGKMLFNARISGRRNRGTTLGIYRDIIPYEPWRVSRTYDNFPMPYPIHYGQGGEFIHAGNTLGYSHGCVRVEAIKSALLWRLVMHHKDDPQKAFTLINLREGQKGKDLKERETRWEPLGYKSAFWEKVKIENSLE